MTTKNKEKEEKLKLELQELFYRAETHFKEACNYLQASYHVVCDLQRFDPDDTEVVDQVLVLIKEALASEHKKMNTSLGKLKVLLKDVVGVEVGVEDYEGECED